MKCHACEPKMMKYMVGISFRVISARAAALWAPLFSNLFQTLSKENSCKTSKGSYGGNIYLE
jgi:hypothetical protein